MQNKKFILDFEVITLAKYSIISDVSDYIVKLLKENLSPEPMLSSQTIELVSPADNNVDYTLGIFLYDIRENTEHLRVNTIPTEDNKLRRPPQSLSLYYMIYMNASAQVAVKAIDSQKILARAQQVLYDNNEIMVEGLQRGLESREENLRIIPSRLTYDEKTRIWTAIDKPYQVALYYTVAPVMLSSNVVIDDVRVRSVRYNYTNNKQDRQRGE